MQIRCHLAWAVSNLQSLRLRRDFCASYARKHASSASLKVYLPFIGNARYKGVVASIVFISNAELMKLAVTLHTMIDTGRVLIFTGLLKCRVKSTDVFDAAEAAFQKPISKFNISLFEP